MFKFEGKEFHSRGAADTNALSPQFLLVWGQDKLIVEEDRRPDREEDILSKVQMKSLN